MYTGVTNDIERCIYEHKEKIVEGFTKRYDLTRLVFFEETDEISSAIDREKQIKGWMRKKKLKLIESENPRWEDLAEDWFE